jgi:hypothetical protein
MTRSLLGAAFRRLGHPVEHQAEADDRGARHQSGRQVALRQAEYGVVAEGTAADQAADDDDGEDEHDTLVDGEEQRRAGERELDLA